MLLQRIHPAPKSSPDQLYRYRENYSADDGQLIITVPPGTIEWQWVPLSCEDNYWVDGCYCSGELSAMSEAVSNDGQLLLNGAIEILLPPGSRGQLAYRSLSPLPNPETKVSCQS